MTSFFRRLVSAVQFLTRLPTPRTGDFAPDDLADAVGFFPLVGALVGGLTAAALFAGGQIDPWFGALLAVAVWVWITGVLHIDGLADIADALAARHGAPERFHEVLKDPRVGTFGAVAIGLQLIGKTVLLALLYRSGEMIWMLVPLCAWARLGPLFWSAYVPVLSPGQDGMSERFMWRVNKPTLAIWSLLLGLTVVAAPALVAAPIFIAAWWLYLRIRLGGQTGDFLGAGIELCETWCIAALVLAASAGLGGVGA